MWIIVKDVFISVVMFGQLIPIPFTRIGKKQEGLQMTHVLKLGLCLA